jgi:hypothetical protein
MISLESSKLSGTISLLEVVQPALFVELECEVVLSILVGEIDVLFTDLSPGPVSSWISLTSIIVSNIDLASVLEVVDLVSDLPLGSLEILSDLSLPVTIHSQELWLSLDSHLIKLTVSMSHLLQLPFTNVVVERDKAGVWIWVPSAFRVFSISPGLNCSIWVESVS